MRTILNRTVGFTPLILVLLCFVAAPGTAEADTGLLDGRTFEVEMGKEGQAEGQPNTLTFRSGTFLSEVCVKYGFPQSVYRAQRSGDSIAFELVARSPSEGHMDWSGTVSGDRIEATAVWHRPGHDEPIELWIRGAER